MKKFYLVLLIAAVSINVAASDKEKFRQKQVRFIKDLYHDGRYFDTIAEIEKLQFAENKPEFEYFIYLNYFSAGQYNTVINNYNPEFLNDEMQFTSLLLLSQSFFKKDMYMESFKILEDFPYDRVPDKYKFTMFLRRVEPLILSGESGIIDQEISRSEIFLKDEYNFTELREELQSYKKESMKSPGYAALMSAVVPGLGQVYAGYPGEGLISILSVAATAAGGVYMKGRDRKGFAYTMFFFSGVFYTGNVYGAYNSAGVYNNELVLNRHKNVVSKYGSYNPSDYIDLESVLR